LKRGDLSRRVSRPRLVPPSIKENKEDLLRFAALGGLEEIGRNCMFFEYKDEIVILDLGLQFPEEETPGIDFIIPNVSYLAERKKNIAAIILTHAHYDHIGAIPYLIDKLGNPPIYATALTKEIVIRRQEDFPNCPKLNIQVIKNRDKIRLSEHFEAEFFGVAHNIPDTTGVMLKTPVGNAVHFADFKFDYDKNDKPLNLDDFKEVAKEKVDLLLLDSTNAEEPGYSLSERVVEKNLEMLFKKSEGRIIIALFASLLTRIAEILKIAERLDRRVALSGFSMKTNIQISQNLGYIKVPKGLIIPLEEIHKYKDDKIMVLTTGAQGEPNASMMRIINGEHRHVQIKPGDTVIFSSSVIPGNERGVQMLKDSLARQGAKIYHSKVIDIHSSGHAPQEELKTVIKIMKPKFYLPVHGHYFMRAVNSELAESVGIPKENIISPANGQVVELRSGAIKLTDEYLPSFYVMVDGLGVGDVGEVVLRDRKMLAQEGMVVIIVTIDRRGGRLLKNPDIISRGFIYLKENQTMLEEIRSRLRALVGRLPRYQPVDGDYLKSLIRDQIGQFLYNKTQRRPMVLPVVIEI
ncbi:MAG: ribonuclease J, partial [Candidatus Brennerbacteria bacterium]|nr:ribonuclease J [Candidatus Brennerbacteria bacterium]